MRLGRRGVAWLDWSIGWAYLVCDTLRGFALVCRVGINIISSSAGGGMWAYLVCDILGGFALVCRVGIKIISSSASKGNHNQLYTSSCPLLVTKKQDRCQLLRPGVIHIS